MSPQLPAPWWSSKIACRPLRCSIGEGSDEDADSLTSTSDGSPLSRMSSIPSWGSELSIQVKNTFLDIGVCNHGFDAAEHGRRAVSEPPSSRRNSFENAMEYAESNAAVDQSPKESSKHTALRPDAKPFSPCGQRQQVVDPVNSCTMCFLAADSMDAENQGLNDAKGVLEKLKVTSADRVANVAMQPMFPYEPIFPDQGPDGYNISVAQASPCAEMPDANAAAMRQSAQCLELAAAALRAQARMGTVAPEKENSKAVLNISGQPTTLMFRNVPNDLTREMLMDIIDSKGFAAKYDFFYLPMDFARAGNLGYAFINAVTHYDGRMMQKAFDGFQSWGIRSRKICQVVWSTSQGLINHIDFYRNSPVMNHNVPEMCKPLLLKDGERVEFPPPTRALKPMRQTDCKARKPAGFF